MWTLYEGDCFDYLPLISDGSVDMVLCDLPYGTTACKWDTPLPLDKLWEQYERVIKPNGVIVLTGSQPFTTTLISSNIKFFRYELIWDKIAVTNPLLANKMPLKCHENILVFYKKLPIYNPQKWEGIKWHRGGKKHHTTPTMGDSKLTNNGNDKSKLKYPKSIIKISNANKTGVIHPTQKPVALFEYLIKTYTNEGDTVLDNCAGSGTTGVACENTGRNSILMEKEPEYCQIIRNRLNELSSQTRLKVEA